MEILRKIWREAWQPPDRRQPWKWCEDHIRSIPYSPQPGRFRSDNSPWIRDVMEAIVDPKVRLVSIMAAVQASKTTAAELSIPYIIENLPGPTLWLDQTDDDARDYSESRLQVLFENCPTLTKQMPTGLKRNRKKLNSIKFNNGMNLWILGAKNKTNLQRRSIRWLFGDETWRWPEGHMAEAEARVTAFGWLGKCVFMSQGGEEDDDTDRKFQTTDQREWMFSCPKCNHEQAYKWENVEWSKSAKLDDDSYDFDEIRRTTAFRCEGCNHHFDDTDRQRRELNARGRFVAQNPRASNENVGFHWNALCSMSWGQLAELYLRGKQAARMGDADLLKQFYQKRLGLPWREYVEDFKLEIVKSGYKRGETWEEMGAIDPRSQAVLCAPLPDRANLIGLIFITVDCQMDHLFIVVRCWSAEGGSRLVWNERILTFTDVEVIQERYGVHPSLVFIDAGHATYDVYRECAKRGWIALMGDHRPVYAHKQKGKKTPVQRFYSPRRKVSLAHGKFCIVHYWSNLNIKDTLAHLRRNQNPANGPTWEVPDDVDDDYLAQLDSEHRIKDKGKWRWVQIGSRPNHYLDCEAMQVVAATMLKIVGREAVKEPKEEAEGVDTPDE